MLNFPKIASLTDPAKRKMALSQFENTALELAENKAGVTPLVVQVCNETAELLRDTVMSAIVSEHDTDVAMLAQAFAAFGPVEEQRAEYEALIQAQIDVVYGPGGLISQHIECRTTESRECVNCGTCRIECENHEETCDELELELRLKYIDVITTVTQPAYCDENFNIQPPSEHTTVSIAEHHLNKQKMEEYLAALAAWEVCVPCTGGDGVCPPNPCTDCPDDPHTCIEDSDHVCVCLNHTTTRTNCNTIQVSLQHAQCEARHLASQYLALYNQAFDGALHRYTLVETQVRIMEADRKVEWDTLERVICLLMTLSIDEDGSASSVETSNAISNCRSMDVDTSHLDIVYPVPPERGTLQDLPHSPCSDEFENDAFTGVPPACGGNEELQNEFDHGLVTECTCTAEPPTPIQVGFPYSIGPFILFDTGLTLNSPEGFQINVGMEAWDAVLEGTTYSGTASPFADTTLPGLDAAYGLEGDQVVNRVAWAYPDPAGTADIVAMNGEEYPETMAHRFIRTGGFVYINEAQTAVALKEISVATPALLASEDAELVLEFGSPNGITEAQAEAACGTHFHPITLGQLYDAGAREYCWDKSNTLPECPHGCFIYKTEGLEEVLGRIAFPVLASTEHSLAFYRASTDQQGAVPWTEPYGPSLETGTLAATVPSQ